MAGTDPPPDSPADPSAPRIHEDIDRLSDFIYAAVDRAHRTIERATTQSTKILATAHAGLGVVLAAWLQRILEGGSDTRLAGLAWYIAVALLPVMLGLLTVGVVCFADVACAQRMTEAVLKQHLQLVRAKSWTEPPDASERTRRAGEDAEIQGLEGRQRQWNTWSQWASVAGWALLAAAFAILAAGVFTVLHEPS